jgi:hypothetical protein
LDRPDEKIRFAVWFIEFVEFAGFDNPNNFKSKFSSSPFGFELHAFRLQLSAISPPTANTLNNLNLSH